MSKIFISYRRSVSQAHAVLLYDRLSKTFGAKNVFLDTEKIPPGETFESYILENLIKSQVFVVFLADGTLTRINDPDDFVRREIEQALNLYPKRIKVLPLLVNEFPMPNEDGLPKTLRKLREINGMILRDASLNDDLKHIVAEIKGMSPPVPKWVWGLVAVAFLLMAAALFRAQILADDSISENPPTEDVLTDTPTDDVFALAMAGVEKNDNWTPYEQEFDGVTMVLVPAGCFMMGENDEQCFDTPFWMDKYEVSQDQFESLGGLKSEANDFEVGDFPVETISWLEAQAFCAGRGGRLPTEREWEYTGRGPEALRFPWGNNFNGQNVVYRLNSINQSPKSVTSTTSGRSWVGALNLIGNVAEWTHSLYLDYPYDEADGREREDSVDGDQRVIRGGSWRSSTEITLDLVFRNRDVPSLKIDTVGFRCARDFE